MRIITSLVYLSVSVSVAVIYGVSQKVDSVPLCYMEGEDRQIVDLSELCDSGNQDGNGTMAEDQWGKAVIDGDIEVITYGDLQIVRGADETGTEVDPYLVALAEEYSRLCAERGGCLDLETSSELYEQACNTVDCPRQIVYAPQDEARHRALEQLIEETNERNRIMELEGGL